jgi:phosphoadenosine phosphosulfate reductase
MPCSMSALETKTAKKRLESLVIQSKRNIIEKKVLEANQKIYYDYRVRQAREITNMANRIFLGNLAVAFSGGKDSLVVLHMVLNVNPNITVIFNNTTVNFPESIKYVRELQKEWGFKLHITRHNPPFLKAVKERGWASHEDRWCCRPYKDRPAFRFLEENKIDAEITGTTRTESIYRRSLTPFRLPKKNHLQIIRVNPIYDWNQWEVWRYIKENELPYNPLYDMKYRRIGCWCCPLNGPTHYRRLRKTHPRLFDFLRSFDPPHPVMAKLCQ